MMTDAADHRTSLDQICWSDYSDRAPDWPIFEVVRVGQIPVRVMASRQNGSCGATSSAALSLSAPDNWPTHLQAQAPAQGEFIPKTEFGRTLWALRQQYIAEGGRLYTTAEIAAELERRERGLD